MTGPTALGRQSLPPSPPIADAKELARVPDNRATPGRRMAPVDRSSVDPQTLKAAEGMESMFLDYMMQAMRKTVPKNDMDLTNAGTEVFQSLLDSEYAQTAARRGGIGLADQIVAYLEAQRYNLKTGDSSPAVQMDRTGTRGTGGTHEGHTNRELPGSERRRFEHK